MGVCVVCNKKSSDRASSFHRFPNNAELREQWIQNIGKPVGWTPGKYSVVCCDHFDLSCFERSWRKISLRKGSVPTILSASGKDSSLNGQDEERAKFLRPLCKVYRDEQLHGAKNDTSTNTVKNSTRNSSLRAAYPIEVHEIWSDDKLVKTYESDIHFEEELFVQEIHYNDTLVDNDVTLEVTFADDEITSVSNKVTTLDDEIIAIDDEVTAVDDEVTAVDDEVTAVDDEVTAVDDEITEVDDEVTAVENIVTLDNEVTLLDNEITLYSNGFVNNEVSSLNTQNTLLNDQGTSLVNRGTLSNDNVYDVTPYIDDHSYERCEESPVEELLQALQLCRFCASPNDYLMNMFIKGGKRREVVDKVNTYLPLTVSKDDTLPLKICLLCNEKINMWHKFVVTCLESDIQLKRKLGIAYVCGELNIQNNDFTVEDISSIMFSHWQKKLDSADIDNTFSAITITENDDAPDGGNPNIDVSSQIIDLSDFGTEENNSSCGPSGQRDVRENSSVVSDEQETSKSEKKRKVMYRCERCGIVFAGSEELVAHQMSDHNIRAFRCTLCKPSVIFDASPDAFRQHMSNIHKRKGETTGKNTSKLNTTSKASVCSESIKRIKNKNQQKCVFGPNKHNSLLTVQRPREGNALLKKKILRLSQVKNNMNILYYCLACHRRFLSKSSYVAHSLKHSDEKRFTCEICNRKYGLKRALKVHMTKHISSNPRPSTKPRPSAKPRHSDKPLSSTNSCASTKDTYLCTHCGRIYKSKAIFDRHQDIHSQQKRLFLCHECGKVCTPRIYYHHIKTHHTPFKLHVCDICGKSVKNLHQHKQTHSGNNTRYCCELCGKICSSRYRLKCHQNIHTGNLLKCPSCPKAFHQNSNLKQHLLQHDEIKQHQCDVCSKRFRRKSHLSLHLNVHREKNYCKEGNKNTNKTSVCRICKEKFESLFEMRYHYAHHTVEEINEYKLQKQQKCEICSNDPNSGECKHHATKKQQKKTATCEICNKMFSNKQTLADHQRCHTGEKPFACNYCNRSFRTSGNLSMHIYSHVREKLFTCEMCSLTFRNPRLLSKHRVSHLTKFKYDCPNCGMKFKTPASLESHIHLHCSSNLIFE